ncbi:hypothetical protein HK414_27980 [Ramlibacter terrae]|uniref:Uncharacterized protein n=1 Tax=Ramlibacter terrae TaxID=2732511 RepID=A0ABX6P6H0_9BURK|nr:hypothetical protein HK414_27980 [Ramlibacter terrae]
MHEEAIYGLTPKGENELRNSATRLSPLELDLLIRIDPSLSVAQLKEALPPEASTTFNAIFERLRMDGLIAPVQLDTFGMRLEEELQMFSQARNHPEADASVRSLKRAGYYVGIARKSRAAPPVAGQQLSAVVVEDDPNLSKFVSSYRPSAASSCAPAPTAPRCCPNSASRRCPTRCCST